MNNCFRVQIYAFNIIRTQKNDFFFRKSADYAIFVLFKDKYLESLNKISIFVVMFAWTLL